MQEQITAWKEHRALLAQQVEMLESGKPRTGTNVPDVTTGQDIQRIRSWIAQLNALISEHSK
jgi:hypothetical protein